eukprot:2777412-Rhodomonas_salina.1
MHSVRPCATVHGSVMDKKQTASNIHKPAPKTADPLVQAFLKVRRSWCLASPPAVALRLHSSLTLYGACPLAEASTGSFQRSDSFQVCVRAVQRVSQNFPARKSLKRLKI